MKHQLLPASSKTLCSAVAAHNVMDSAWRRSWKKHPSVMLACAHSQPLLMVPKPHSRSHCSSLLNTLPLFLLHVIHQLLRSFSRGRTYNQAFAYWMTHDFSVKKRSSWVASSLQGSPCSHPSPLILDSQPWKSNPGQIQKRSGFRSSAHLSGSMKGVGSSGGSP